MDDSSTDFADLHGWESGNQESTTRSPFGFFLVSWLPDYFDPFLICENLRNLRTNVLSTHRRPPTGSNSAGQLRVEHCSACHRLGPRRYGKHSRHLRSHDRRSSSPLDEGTKREWRLADGRIFDVAVFNYHAKATRHRQGTIGRTKHGNSAIDRAIVAQRS